MGAPWTRDATVRAYVVTMAPEVAGRIVELPVADNQYVRKGDLLMTIDPTNYTIAASQAEAAVQQPHASIDNTDAQIGVQQAQINASQAQLPDLRSIPWFDRSDHPFVPTCRLAERRAQWKSPRRGRREAEHRALGRLTERARRYTPNTRATARRRPARLPPRNVLDYWWGVPRRSDTHGGGSRLTLARRKVAPAFEPQN